MLNIDLTGRTALVTGAARGIGRSSCEVLSIAGANVGVLGPRNTQTVADDIISAGGNALSLAADVTDIQQLQSAVQSLAEKFGGIDILVTSAGTTSLAGIDDLDYAEWNRILDINLTGTFNSVKAALPWLRKSKCASIVLIGSAAIVAGSGGGVHYAASKSGLEGLMRGLARELGPDGIRVNMIHPSLIVTDLLCSRHPDPQKREALAKETPLRHLGTPEDVANLAAYLSSDLARFITAQSIFVDGGRTFCK
jgi:3-oxoacyl-[acyl-carrier protein] reductase